MSDLTKVTNSVISSNTIMGYNIQSNQIENRHYINGSIDITKLDETANVSAVQSNVSTTTNAFRANDFATFLQSKANDYLTYQAALANDYATFLQVTNDFVNVTGDVMTGSLDIRVAPNSIGLEVLENANSASANGIAIITNDLGVVYLIPKKENVLQTANALTYSLPNNRWEFGTSPYSGGSSVIWHEGNDGPGSGLNADLLDGQEYSDIQSSFNANDFATYNAILAGTDEFTAPLKIFQGDVIIIGNVTVEGNSFTANTETVTSEDTTIAVNWNGTDATAEGAGLAITGSNNQILANIVYASGSGSKFRLGTGPLTSADDIARRQDYQANDSITFTFANANDYTTYTQITNDYRANDVVTYLAAMANDLTTFNSAKANDFSTYNQLGTEYKANDYATYIAAMANDYNSYLSLTANLNVLQDNIASIGATINVIPWTNTVTSTSSNIYFVGAPGTIPGAEYVSIFLGGVAQPENEWVLNTGNNTIQFIDTTMIEGEYIIINAFYKP